MKRIFDIAVSFVGLLILSPLLFVIALLIKLESRGPVFYRGERVGKDGKIFRIYKFRSMIVDADKAGGSTTSSGDPRVTGVGKVVRKFKLDELSQLINVLFGDMSIVGPRPQVQWAVNTYNEEERRILQLRPGITDWASIKFHNEGEIIANSGMADSDEAYMKLIHPEKTRLQLRYLKEHNIWIDIQIISQTVATLFVTRV
jgi:lipopolysaccharide/colanic/teichoic acid biosynthesis glycosyltransferase